MFIKIFSIPSQKNIHWPKHNTSHIYILTIQYQINIIAYKNFPHKKKQPTNKQKNKKQKQ